MPSRSRRARMRTLVAGQQSTVPLWAVVAAGVQRGSEHRSCCCVFLWVPLPRLNELRGFEMSRCLPSPPPSAPSRPPPPPLHSERKMLHAVSSLRSLGTEVHQMQPLPASLMLPGLSHGSPRVFPAFPFILSHNVQVTPAFSEERQGNILSALNPYPGNNRPQHLIWKMRAFGS